MQESAVPNRAGNVKQTSLLLSRCANATAKEKKPNGHPTDTPYNISGLSAVPKESTSTKERGRSVGSNQTGFRCRDYWRRAGGIVHGRLPGQGGRQLCRV